MGGKGAGKSPGVKDLSSISKELFALLRPLMRGLTNQTLEVLRGGANAFSPSITGVPNAASLATPPQKMNEAGDPLFTHNDLSRIWGQFADSGSQGDLGYFQQALKPEFTMKEFQGALAADHTMPLTGKKKKPVLRGASTKAAISQALSEFGEAAAGGGGSVAGSTLPILQSAVEQSKLGQARGLEALERQLRISGGGTNNPFAQATLAKARVLGEQQTAQIPGRLAEQFLFGLAPQLLGQQSLAFSGLAQAAGIQSGAAGPTGPTLGGALGSAAGGAASGALAGAAAGGVGAPIGALIGGLGGLASGIGR